MRTADQLAHRSVSGDARAFPAPLLGWQVLLCGYVLGILAFRYHGAAAVGLVLLLMLVRLLAGGRPHFAAILLSFLIGLAWTHLRMPEAPDGIPQWMEQRQKVQVRARVEALQSRPGERLQILLGDVRCTPKGGVEEPLPGRLLWTWEKPLQWPRKGQLVEGYFRIRPVRGYLNPGGFDSEFHWQREGVFHRTFTFREKAEVTLSLAPDGIRDALREQLAANASGQGGAILTAVLLGERFFLDQATVELMQKSSLAHSLAQSGLHLGLVVSIGFLLAWTVGLLRPSLLLSVPRPRLGVLLALPLALFYAWLGQFSPSLLRAGLMFVFWGGLLFLGRDRVLMDGLFMAVGLILVAFPLSAFDLSLQLSAGAVAGIVLLWPVFDRWVAPLKATLAGKALVLPASMMAVSVAANLVLLPLSLSSFGFASHHLHLNLLWLPLLGFAVLPFGAAGLAMTFVPLLAVPGQALLGAASLTAEWMVGLLSWMDGRGWIDVVWTMRPTWPLCMAYWLVVLAAFIARRASRAVLGLLLGSAVAMVLLFAAQRAWDLSHDLRLTLLDVGQGQAVLLEVGPERYLIDGGGSFDPEYDFGRAVIGPALTWGRLPRVDGIILSHPHSDHLRGLLHPLGNFRVGFFAENGDPPAGADLEALQGSIAKSGLEPRRWQAGEVIDLGRGIALEVLHPTDGFRGKGENDRSLVLRVLKNGRGLALIPGDVEKAAQRLLLEAGPDLSSQVLVLPHHGSKSSLHPGFYESVGPEVALCSSGYLNHFGLPHPQVLDSLSSLDIPLLRTDLEGAVTISWDGDGRISSMRTHRRGIVLIDGPGAQ
jgi:competence protein ComEC